MLDMQSLLLPVSGAAPGGENLEYSAEYSALTRTLQGKPERRMGEAVVAAEPPDWSTAIDQASALLRKSKDLRIATELTRALLKRDGYAGLAQGLAVIRGLLETFWAVLYPQLDEGDHDPTSRINAMAALTHRDMVSAVRAAPMVKSRVAGAISLKDVEAAARSRDGSGGATPSWDSVLQAVSLPELIQAARDVDVCEREARELEVAWKMQLDSVGHGANGGGTRAAPS
jgi:type VI secretion system protein ImpA